MNDGLPWSAACERNKRPIQQVLARVLVTPGTVLEIGAGTGQHAVHFAATLPHLTWLPSDVAAALPTLQARCRLSTSSNLLTPICFDVQRDAWPATVLLHVFSANTAHIMAWSGVEALFMGVGERLTTNGRFCLYGPFHEHGQPTSEGNRAFDEMLRARDPHSGIRDLDALDALAARCGLQRIETHPMPANNQLLVWSATLQNNPGLAGSN